MNQNLGRAAVFTGALFVSVNAQATDIAIKSGETIELDKMYYVSNCRSILKTPPVAELLSGPEGITVKLTPKQVLPRTQNCSKEVAGGILSITAKDISEISRGQVIIRIKYDTK